MDKPTGFQRGDEFPLLMMARLEEETDTTVYLSLPHTDGGRYFFHIRKDDPKYMIRNDVEILDPSDAVDGS